MRLHLRELGLIALLAASGCKKDAKGDTAKGLPPATGQGSPPAATLPVIDGTTPPLGARTGESRTTGTTFAAAEAKVGPKVSGVLAKIFVAEGSVVKKGDPLFRQDARSIALMRDQALAGLHQAELNLRATQVEYDRMKGLVDQGAVNRAQWDQMQARLDGAKLGVEQAKIGVAQGNQALADATVRSPIDGVVVMKFMSEGEMATMMPPSIVVMIQDLSSLELRVRLPEKALATVKPGTVLRARFDALGVTREAKVVRLSPAVDPRSRTIEVFAIIPNQDGSLKPGMLADVEVGK